jgi:hypothetical protein
MELAGRTNYDIYISNKFGLLIDGTSPLSMKEYWKNSASYEKKKKSTRRRAQLVPMGMLKIYWRTNNDLQNITQINTYRAIRKTLNLYQF